MSPSNHDDDVEWIGIWELRECFNKLGLYDRLRAGELTSVVEHNQHRGPADHPPCTRSQTLVYFDINEDPLCLVHQYTLPDGQIGASGKPDPLLIFLPERTLGTKEH